ncbi:MAG: PAS domain S-box protein [Bacteroidales bacterium]|nr:PAS domain S-box protein [Bacteroidales bacterium]MCF8458015.1 PAS domain S-box protein [Bacteroidales bacterium]
MNETEKTKQQLIEENEALKATIAEFERLETDRAKAGKAIVESEEKKKAQQYLDIADVMLISIDLMGIVQLVNPKGCEVLGYPEEEIIGKNWFDNFIPERMRKPVKEVAKKVFSGEMEAVKYYENEILTKSGAERIIAWHNSILKDDSGKVIGTLSSGEDITERKKHELDLKRSRQRFEDLVNLLPEAVFETDQNFVLTYVNQRALDVFGYTGEDILIGMNGLEMLIPEDRDRGMKNFMSRYKGDDPGMVEYKAIKKNGSIFPILFHASSITENGKLIGIRGIIIDITDRKKIEDELYESKELFSLFMRYSPIYTFIKEVTPNESRVLIASENFKDMIGIPGSEMEGKTMYELFPAEFAKKITDDDWAVVSEGTVMKLDEDLNGRNYTSIKFPITLGGKTMLSGYTIDNTERTIAEIELRKSKQILEGIMNSIPVRVFWKDKNLVYLGCNLAFAQDAGFSDPKDIIGKDDFQMIWQSQAELYRSDDLEVIKSGIPKLNIEEPQTTPDGSTITLLTSKSPLLNSNGEVTGVLGTYMDISERKMAEEALQDSEEKFSKAFQTSPYAITLTKIKNGEFIEINDAFSTITGFSREEAIANSSLGLNLWVDIEERNKMIFELLSGQIVSGKELRFKRKNGEIMIGLFSAQIINLHTEPYILASIDDITKRKQVDQELAKYREHLEDLVKERTAELEEKNAELEKFNNLFVGRELRIKELKDKVKELEKRLQNKN